MCMMLVLGVAFIAGCAVTVGHRAVGYSTTTQVDGYGRGATEAEAKRAAWDDAIARLAAMGHRGYSMTSNGCRITGKGGVYEAEVWLTARGGWAGCRFQPVTGAGCAADCGCARMDHDGERGDVDGDG